jgi:hypothetical protein
MTKSVTPKLRNYLKNNTGYMQVVINERYEQIIDTANDVYIDGGDLLTQSSNRKIKIIVNAANFCVDYWRSNKLNPLSDIESSPTLNGKEMLGIKMTCDLLPEIYNNSVWNNGNAVENTPLAPVWIKKFKLYRSTNSGGSVGNAYNSRMLNYGQEKYGNSTGDGADKGIMFYNGSSEATADAPLGSGEWTFPSSTQDQRFNCNTFLVPHNRCDIWDYATVYDYGINNTYLKYLYNSDNDNERLYYFYNGSTYPVGIRQYNLSDGSVQDYIVPSQEIQLLQKTFAKNNNILLIKYNISNNSLNQTRMYDTKTKENNAIIEATDDYIEGRRIFKIIIKEQTISCSANTYKDCLNSSICKDIYNLPIDKILKWKGKMTLPDGTEKEFDSEISENADLPDNNYLVFFYNNAITSRNNKMTGTIGSVAAGNYKWEAEIYFIWY